MSDIERLALPVCSTPAKVLLQAPPVLLGPNTPARRRQVAIPLLLRSALLPGVVMLLSTILLLCVLLAFPWEHILL